MNNQIVTSQWILVRHGIAEAADVRCPEDTQRPLTKLGQRRTEETALGLRWLRVTPQRVVTSPLVRATQTADILREILAPKLPLETCEDLAPGGDPAKVLAWLQPQDGEKIVLVGHVPDLCKMVASLVSAASDLHIGLKRAGACRVDFPGPAAFGEGTLRWLLTPRMLRGIARLH